MRYRLTGVGGLGFSINWESSPGDREVARRVVNYLEDRRLLWGDRHGGDERHCIKSAIEIRQFLTGQISEPHVGKHLTASLKAMRGACRKFVEAGGMDGMKFGYECGSYEARLFGMALGDLRTSIGVQVDVIARKYDLEVEEELARILPASDDGEISWIPGFEDE